ncbi:MAG TPA: sigma-70 family RNA polymerase sigma factor [bacterium]|jgi:RNA polymerase sigma-70 factor (ECF subfamily)|nr:sigma-70 family RNA polymerase sigma factor [bacterium]
MSEPPAKPLPTQREAERARDRDLMGRVTRGEQDALAELMARWTRPVYSLALRILRNPELAEEVTQDVFLKVWKHAALFEEQRGAFSSWVLTMTHHGSIDALRRAKARGSQVTNVLDNVLSATLPSPRPGVSPWQKLRLEQALETLPPRQREVVELAYYGGHTREEMARILNEPVGTVKTRLRDAIQRLAEVFRDPDEALAHTPGFQA